MDRTIHINKFPTIDVFSEDSNFHSEIKLVSEINGLYTYKFSISSEQPNSPKPITLRWCIPSFNMKGVWKPGGVHDKRQQYDWELEHVKSRVSVDAPVICVFGHDDSNIHTIACSDAANLISMNALLREEDNYEYCHLSFFTERHPEISSYTCDIRIDTRPILFSQALQEVSQWWESYDSMKPSPIPAVASVPLYSSWYQFHQDLDPEVLLSECKLAYDLGYELIILDDGWQTKDSNRGYDYTGDWEPERFPNMADFVQKVKATGMKFGLWYSVPFCGKHSKAYQKFKGKFLTEEHRWAPVFDPRYPEVRQYLIDTYVKALKDWKLDAFKLDFIDEFKVYPSTVLTKEDGRDYANVNEAVIQLFTDAMTALRAINPDIGIEFRQQYVGPILRKFGNMFRAFDCPNDAVSNRIRVTDVKLLCGATAVHSDPQTWHIKESVEVAALQVLNSFYGVPQMSMLLSELPKDHLAMIKFYTSYWRVHQDILLNGHFKPTSPLANYPVLESTKDQHTIIGVYEDAICTATIQDKLDIINAKRSNSIVLRSQSECDVQVIIYNCQGDTISQETQQITKGLIEFTVPPSGLIRITKNTKT